MGNHPYVLFIRLPNVRGFDHFLKDLPLPISRHMICKQNDCIDRTKMKTNQTSHIREPNRQYDVKFQLDWPTGSRAIGRGMGSPAHGATCIILGHSCEHERRKE